MVVTRQWAGSGGPAVTGQCAGQWWTGGHQTVCRTAVDRRSPDSGPDSGGPAVTGQWAGQRWPGRHQTVGRTAVDRPLPDSGPDSSGPAVTRQWAGQRWPGRHRTVGRTAAGRPSPDSGPDSGGPAVTGQWAGHRWTGRHQTVGRKWWTGRHQTVGRQWWTGRHQTVGRKWWTGRHQTVGRTAVDRPSPDSGPDSGGPAVTGQWAGQRWVGRHRTVGQTAVVRPSPNSGPDSVSGWVGRHCAACLYADGHPFVRRCCPVSGLGGRQPGHQRTDGRQGHRRHTSSGDIAGGDTARLDPAQIGAAPPNPDEPGGGGGEGRVAGWTEERRIWEHRGKGSAPAPRVAPTEIPYRIAGRQ